MNIINKWKEYDDGKLTAPAIVQYDTVGDENLVWVWTGENIIQVSRFKYDENQVIVDVMSLPKEEIAVDPKDAVISELQTQVKTLQTEKAVLLEEKATWLAVNPIYKEVIK